MLLFIKVIVVQVYMKLVFVQANCGIIYRFFFHARREEGGRTTVGERVGGQSSLVARIDGRSSDCVRRDHGFVFQQQGETFGGGFWHFLLNTKGNYYMASSSSSRERHLAVGLGIFSCTPKGIRINCLGIILYFVFF